MIRWYRYVRHADRPSYEAAGWVFAADLGPTHGQWSVLMEINLPAFTGKAAPNSPSLEKTKFGRLTVMGRAPNVRPKFSAWHCLCECGVVATVEGQRLVSGKTRSCGCLQEETRRSAKGRVRHGMSRTPTHNTWGGMKQRCENPASPRWADWGGRGIRVCDRWQSFDLFLADMGEKPRGRSLDRINNNGNYEPGNCRWATAKEQAANRRSRAIKQGEGEPS